MSIGSDTQLFREFVAIHGWQVLNDNLRKDFDIDVRFVVREHVEDPVLRIVTSSLHENVYKEVYDICRP